MLDSHLKINMKITVLWKMCTFSQHEKSNITLHIHYDYTYVKHINMNKFGKEKYWKVAPQNTCYIIMMGL